MAKDSIQEFLRNFLRENPDKTTMPSRTLARFLHEHYFEMFPSVEHARDHVRTIRGKHGGARREETQGVSGEFYDPVIFYDVPKCLADEYEVFTIPKSVDKAVFLFDVHVPFHDNEVVMLAARYGLERGAKTVILPGDFMDCYWLSNFVKRGHKHPFTYKEEVDATMQMLDYLQELFENVYYKFGNHEDRFEAYLNRVPELKSDNYYSLANRLQLRERGIAHIESPTYMNFGKLKILHGHEYGSGRSNPVSMARTLLTKAKQSAMCGHAHTTSEHVGKKLDGSFITCWSVGCACDLHPAYRPHNDTNHGFAYVEITDDDGGFRVENKRVHNGKIM